jgi:stearoyl-CoA desaturase (delta-9 desaturase)
VQKGFWWSHMGWILADEYEETELEAIRDFTKYPELVWLDRNQFLAPMLYGLGLWLAFSWTGLFWGFFLSTVLLWHGTFAINSVMHVFGKRVFETRDTSRNSFLMALVTMGEGWHNNHHHFQASAAQGFLWWQADPSLWLLRTGRLLGIVKDLRPVPTKVVALARERAVWHFSSRTFERAREAFDAAQAGWDARAEQLSAHWTERRETALASASQRLAELEASRQRAAARLEELKADYSAALSAATLGTRLRGQRAKALAEIRVEELRVEIERTRRSLVEALERLVEASGMGDGHSAPA